MGRAGDGRCAGCLGQEEAISLSDRQNHSGARLIGFRDRGAPLWKSLAASPSEGLTEQLWTTRAI